MLVELLLLRLVHVVAGTFWVGSALFSTFFLLPSLGEAGPAAASVMAGFQKRKLMTIVPAMATLTLLSGIRLLWIISDGFAPGFIATARGFTFTLSGVLAILAFALGMMVNRPINARLGRLAQAVRGAGDAEREALSEEMRRLRGRSAAIAFTVALLLIVATAGMGIARYL